MNNVIMDNVGMRIPETKTKVFNPTDVCSACVRSDEKKERK